jgi:hypothetical protein
MQTLPRNVRLRDTAGSLTVPAAATGSKLRRFSMVAYTGAVVETVYGGERIRLIVTLSGIKPASQRIPALLIHEFSDIAGNTESITITNGGVFCDGIMSGPADVVARVAETADNGFPWQASAGFAFPDGALTFLDAGMSEVVNGQTVTGPIFIARTAILSEVSFTPIGADNKTSSVILSFTSAGTVKTTAPAAQACSAEVTLSVLIGHYIKTQGMTRSQATSKTYNEHRDVVAKWSAELSADKAAMAALSVSSDNTPEAVAYRCQAIAEARANPAVLKGFNSLGNFVTIRAAELSGRLRTTHTR